MHINEIDLNLLRVFDAVYRHGNVSRAAEELSLSQPATSQALTRLRLKLKDPLFRRAQGGVLPTPRADRLAQAVRQAIITVEAALNEAERFEPAQSRKTFRIHLSDIGEARFLPPLMTALDRQAPQVRLHSAPLPHDEIAPALDSGRLDLAIGYLPAVHDTQRLELTRDHYSVLLRAGHPRFATRPTRAVPRSTLAQLDYVAVRSHSETLRILQLLRLEERIRLYVAHFLALPDIVRHTDLAVVMPHDIARTFMDDREAMLIEPQMPRRDFGVDMHWSRRFQDDPAQRWLRELVAGVFRPAG